MKSHTRPADAPALPEVSGGHPATPVQPPPRDDRDVLGARLTDLAGMLDERDRAMGRVARLLVAVSADDSLPERLGGMSLQVWLEHVGRIPGAEARALLGVVDVLAHLPITLTGLCDGWLSWGQAQAIAKAARRVRVARLSELDGRVQEWMTDRADVEPDAIIADVREWVDAAQPTRLEREEAARERDEFLTLMPRLFGGGSVYGEYGPVGFATLAEALDAPLAPPPATPDDLTDDGAVAEGYDTLDEQRRQLTRQYGAGSLSGCWNSANSP